MCDHRRAGRRQVRRAYAEPLRLPLGRGGDAEWRTHALAVKVDELPHVSEKEIPVGDRGILLWRAQKGRSYGAALDARELYPDLGEGAALAGGGSLLVLLTVYVLRNQHLISNGGISLPNPVLSRLSFSFASNLCIHNTSAFNSAS
ncbi:hypothetical protein ACEPAI_3109 [Sanghuangporus weigelae]